MSRIIKDLEDRLYTKDEVVSLILDAAFKSMKVLTEDLKSNINKENPAGGRNEPGFKRVLEMVQEMEFEIKEIKEEMTADYKNEQELRQALNDLNKAIGLDQE